jgi:hypothetical protein
MDPDTISGLTAELIARTPGRQNAGEVLNDVAHALEPYDAMLHSIDNKSYP